MTKGFPVTGTSTTSDGMTRAEWEGLSDQATGYPANHFAFQQVLNVLAEEQARTLVEIGIGQGSAIPIFAGAGLEMSGLDIDDALVAKSRQAMADCGLNPDTVVWGDIRDGLTYPSLRRLAPFDSLLAMGVLPHVQHELSVLANMRALVRPGGLVFVECRNSLFSLITFNRYTHEFFMDELFADAPADARKAIDAYLQSRLAMDRPPKRRDGHESTFHNPFEVPRMFRQAGLVDVVIRPFHYHAAMPVLEAELGQSFRDGSLAMENEPSGWRGLFLCSAFIVQARRPLGDAGSGGAGSPLGADIVAMGANPKESRHG